MPAASENEPLGVSRRHLLRYGALLGAMPVVGGLAVGGADKAAAAPMEPRKTASTYYTPQRVANARRNIERYGWARAVRDQAVAAAAPFLAFSDEFLWEFVTPQSVSRSLGVLIRYRQRIKGSPGPEGAAINKFGNYPWLIDPIARPWKLQSPVTGELYPSNDFASFYRAGIDEHGVFDPELARRNGSQYLVNELYPERGEGWGVDDGSGWTDGDGDTWTFIAYYNHWGVWNTGGGKAFHGFVLRALNALRDAYLYTGEPRYAHKGLVLLDRIADLYPGMDVSAYRWEDGFDNGDPAIHTAQGKILHDIWETGVARTFILAYDAFYPAIATDADLLRFVQAQAQRYQLATPKNSAADVRTHIEDHVLRLIYPAVQNSRIRGNTGSHQSVLALAAVVLDEDQTSKEWLEFVFQPGELKKVADPDAPYGRRWIVTGGNVARVFVSDVDRDGWGNEAAPGYNVGWLNTFLQLADAVDGYQRYPDYDLFGNVKFLNMFTAYYKIFMLSRYAPSIGDSGNTGGPGLLGALATEVLGYSKTKDPGLAQLVHLRNGNGTANLHGSIFDVEPEQLVTEIDAVVAKRGPFQLPSTHQTGYGFSALRSGTGAHAHGMWLYYGRSIWHGHADTLNLGVHAHGMDVSPDLGYPEVTGLDPERLNWTSATVSHNTVVVDGRSQATQWVAIPRLISETERVKLVEVDAPLVYPQTELYRRSIAMVRIDDATSYAVDFFRVAGGADHVFSFHGAKGTVSTTGLSLTAQVGGSYAGPDVPFQDPAYNADGRRSGFNYLSAVERDDAPAGPFAVDWAIADNWNVHPVDPDAHLRLTMLSQVDDVALADGVPPRNKPGNPDRLRYLLARRRGENLRSNFTSVIETYVGQRRVVSCELAPVSQLSGTAADRYEVTAVKVTLSDGRVDYVVSAVDERAAYLIDGDLVFQGRFGVYSVRDGEAEYRYLHGGARFAHLRASGPVRLAQVTGTVVDFTRDLSLTNEIVVDLTGWQPEVEVDMSSLVGSYLHVTTDNVRNGTYEIRGLRAVSPRRYVIAIGNQTLIRGLIDPNDSNGGYTYDIAVGAACAIPVTYQADAARGEPVA